MWREFYEIRSVYQRQYLYVWLDKELIQIPKITIDWEAILSVIGKCCKYPNYVIPSGWDNIDVFFHAVDEFYITK